MAGRPDVTITSQFGVETTPGTPVAANRLLPTISFTPKIKRDTKQFRAQGNKYNTTSHKAKQYAEGGYDGILDYNSIIYILNGLTVPVTSPAAIVGSTSGKKWSYAPVSRALDNPKTYTFEVGGPTELGTNLVEQYAYGQLTSLTLDLNQDDLKLSGNMICQTAVANFTQTASPTIVPERPCQRDQIDVFCDNVYATFNGATPTKVTDAMEEKIEIGVKFKPKFVHNTTFKSFKDAVEVAPSFVYSFLQEHNAQSRTALADVIANDTPQWLRIQAKGLDISDAHDGSITELIQFDVYGKYTEPEEVRDALTMGVYGYRYHFVALDDPANMGRPWRAVIQNTVASL